MNEWSKSKFLVTDPRWRQLKDFALFMLAIVGLYSWLIRPATIAERIEARLSESEKVRRKYVPIVDIHETRITRMEVRQEEQFSRIMAELAALNRKLDR